MKIEEFIKKANEIHNNKYDYSKVNFIKMSDVIIIKCLIHGEFSQKVSVHINDKCGCKQCGLINRKSTKKTNFQFIEEANLIHNNFYNYELCNYKTAQNNVTIICPIHGEFSIKPYAHIGSQKQGCYKCGIKNRVIKNKITTEEFINKCKIKWKDKYDYSNTQYVNKITKIKYICKEHGEQNQYPKLHIKHGCQYCSGRGISKYNNETFEKVANQIYNNKFDYSNIHYINSHEKIKINCIKHGEFEQLPYVHLNLKYGCAKCAKEADRSIPETEIYNFIKKNYNGEVLSNQNILNGKEIDIYIPEYKLGIEYHGLYWHVENVVGKNYHKYKSDIADSLGIKLLQIYESEYKEKKEIVFSIIKSNLRLNEKIHARKTKIIELSLEDKNIFLNNNHLQGNDKSEIYYGLSYENKIVSCMTFGKSRYSKNNSYELIRYSNLINNNVIGGAGKLLNHFLKRHNKQLITYADRRWSNGNLYNKIGFKFIKLNNPGYHYVNLSNKKIYNRIKFQKHKLKNMQGYSNELTEYQIMKLNGFDRIWDCGQFVFSI